MNIRNWLLDKIGDHLTQRRMPKLVKSMYAEGYPGLDPRDQDEAAILDVWEDVRKLQSPENNAKRHFGYGKPMEFEGPDVDDVDVWS